MLPEALIVFDRFHVMKLMNEKLADLRRELVRQTESEDAMVATKGTRWLLSYRRHNLPRSCHRAVENRPLAGSSTGHSKVVYSYQKENNIMQMARTACE